MSKFDDYTVFKPGFAPDDLVTERQLQQHWLAPYRPPVAAYLELSQVLYPMYSLREARKIALNRLDYLILQWQQIHDTTEDPTLDDIRGLLSGE